FEGERLKIGNNIYSIVVGSVQRHDIIVHTVVAASEINHQLDLRIDSALNRAFIIEGKHGCENANTDGCCGNRYSVVLPDTRMSMTPSACDTIRRCAGSSAAKPSCAVQLRRARLAALRHNGLLQTRTFLLLPTCPANGSTLCMAADRPAASCSTWIRA